MKVYKKIMGVITVIENIVLAISLLMVLILTFGNVIARYVFHHSWGFTEELTVAVFVLVSLLGAGVAARKGELVNLALVTDNVGPKVKKVLLAISNIICIVYSLLLCYEAFGRIKVDHTFSPILHISKMVFWSFVLIGGISLVLHFIEHTIDYLRDNKEVK
ncbi:MAG: TRAP transporter small permease [Eubacteriales bacterium]|nr:TRAP transporter small permease [Eubacteriales bacterium]